MWRPTRRGAIGSGAQTVNWRGQAPNIRAGTRRAPCRFGGSARRNTMELLTPLETICRLILRAKELEAQVPAEDPDDDPDDVDDLDDEGGEALSVLQDELNDGVEEEVQALLDDLAEDQLAEVVA